MKALMKSDPYCQYYIGKATAYRIAASLFTANQSGYAMFRGLMRDNAKTAITLAKITKGVI